MKDRVMVTMKKWWLVVLVFTCALSLTSCSKKKSTELLSGEPGYTQCRGTIGDFDIWVYHSEKQAGMYDVYVIPYQLDAAGDIASITVANSNLGYKQMVGQVVLNPEKTIYAGQLTEEEIFEYNIMAITPFDPTNNFASQQPEKDAFCEYNIPADVAGTY